MILTGQLLNDIALVFFLHELKKTYFTDMARNLIYLLQTRIMGT